jgi:hypothetical protein
LGEDELLKRLIKDSLGLVYPGVTMIEEVAGSSEPSWRVGCPYPGSVDR